MGPLEHKEEGNRLFKQQEWRRAADEYAKGLSDSSGELPVDQRGLLLSNRSQCMLNLEEWDSALSDADACLQILPEHAKSYFRRAAAQEKLGKTEEALADYIKVIKLDPKNQASIGAARRLREDVLKWGQQRRDVVAPGYLLDILRGSGSTEEKVDTCGKLRAICVHRSLTGTLLSSGAIELLVEKAEDTETAPDVRDGMLHLLITMASGHEAQDEDEPRTAPPATGPLPVAPAAAQARSRLRAQLHLATLRPLCRGHGKSARHLAMLVGLTHEPEDSEALEAIHDALSFSEECDGNVPRAGVSALSGLLDMRRRLGRKGKCLMPTAALLKCVESALNTSSCSEHLRALMALVWALLADKEDRPKSMEFDLPDVALKVLEPFLQSTDWTLKANGLGGLSALLAASAECATDLLSRSSAPLVAILSAIKRPDLSPDGVAARDHAVECMLLCAGDRKTRQHFVDGDGIEILLGILADGEEGSSGVIRAKMIAVLAIVAGHNKDVREEVFDRMDFLAELRHALDIARESASFAKSDEKQAAKAEEAKRLCKSLYESCACLSIHGEFKELLMGSKRTLKAMLDLVGTGDLGEDPQLAFLYASLAYNLCRSRDDKVRPKRDQFPFSELGEDDLNALEEFYEKMPAEARPVKNGEVDAGSAELADKFRAWCVHGDGSTSSSSVINHLAKCAAAAVGSARVKGLVASVLKFLCASQAHRKLVVSSGGVRALLGLVDLEDEPSRDAARQALAQILIVTNPALLQYSEQLDSVRPLVQMMEHRHELLQFEATMGLTNLLTVSDELRSRALQANAWQVCRDLLFAENEKVQRAGLEAMCNLCMAEEVIERFATGKGELEFKIFCSLCHADDKAARIAASGALAMLAGSCEEVAVKLAACESFGHLLESIAESPDAEVQHRVAAALAAVCEAELCPAEIAAGAKAALRARLNRGYSSPKAESVAHAVLEEVPASAAGGG